MVQEDCHFPGMNWLSCMKGTHEQNGPAHHSSNSCVSLADLASFVLNHDESHGELLAVILSTVFPFATFCAESASIRSFSVLLLQQQCQYLFPPLQTPVKHY